MNQRLKMIRKAKHMTQTELAEILNIKQTAVSAIESGRASLTARNKQMLYEKLYVNPDYLEHGIGDIFLPELPQDTFSRILSEIEESEDSFIKTFLQTYWALNANDKQVIQSFVHALAQADRKDGTTKHVNT